MKGVRIFDKVTGPKTGIQNLWCLSMLNLNEGEIITTGPIKCKRYLWDKIDNKSIFTYD